MEQRRSLALKVGAFVLAGTVVAFVVLVVLGLQRHWFTPKITFRAGFSDVAGLREGAPVRLAGRDVGLVTGIEFSDDPDPARAVVVAFKVPRQHAGRIRADSVASIGSQGLLGDKLLDLTLGDPAAPPAGDGAWLTGLPPQTLEGTLGRADDAIGEATRALAAARRVVERVEQGPGTLHALLYEDDLHRDAARAVAHADRLVRAVDPKEVHRVVGNLERASAKVAEAADSTAVVAETVKKGRGTLGGLVMDPTLYEETKRIMANIRRNRVLSALARYVISRDEPVDIMDASPATVEIVPRRAPKPAPAIRRVKGTEPARH
jgi:phospholipid/cholesterol/gamma-HCH transport system substrate-binding protein